MIDLFLCFVPFILWINKDIYVAGAPRQDALTLNTAQEGENKGARPFIHFARDRAKRSVSAIESKSPSDSKDDSIDNSHVYLDIAALVRNNAKDATGSKSIDNELITKLRLLNVLDELIGTKIKSLKTYELEDGASSRKHKHRRGHKKKKEIEEQVKKEKIDIEVQKKNEQKKEDISKADLLMLESLMKGEDETKKEKKVSTDIAKKGTTGSTAETVISDSGIKLDNSAATVVKEEWEKRIRQKVDDFVDNVLFKDDKSNKVTNVIPEDIKATETKKEKTSDTGGIKKKENEENKGQKEEKRIQQDKSVSVKSNTDTEKNFDEDTINRIVDLLMKST